ncbi:hypothetical protein DFJ63DRAFT_336662 [Scheffersomyces coipomensis]|uniref:uncharacterized protein n=1 Tax=Scheffersomyces coipomensis TaxID=1788519 RepID=UPI00315D15AC
MKFIIFKYLIVFYSFLTVAYAMGEGYEELTAYSGDSLGDYNVYFIDIEPITVEPREFRDFNADIDSIVIECINFWNLTTAVEIKGNGEYLYSLRSDDDEFEYSDGTLDYLHDSEFLSFNCQSY